MQISAVLSYAAAYLSLILTIGILLRDRHSFVHRAFATGMFLFAAEELCRGMSNGSILPDDIVYWQHRVLACAALIPAAWLAFSISYGRADSTGVLSRWKWFLLSAGLAPIPFIAVFRKSLFLGTVYLEDVGQWSIGLGWPGRALKLYSIVMSVLILFNLERTIRSSIGRMRWQIKFIMLGVGGLFGLRIYLASQALLFSKLDTGLGAMNAVAIIAADLLFALSLFRSNSLNMNVYLSTATIQNSITVIIAGIYLLSVGVLARVVRFVDPSQSQPFDAFVVFIGLTALAVLLLSDRLRRKLRLFVSQHFRRPLYDYRRVWMELTNRTTSLVDVSALSVAASRMICESLDILSVSVWLVDESQRRLTLGGSTALSGPHVKEIEKAGKSAPDFIRFLREHPGCIDLAGHEYSWPKEIMNAGKDFFREFSIRYVVGLQAGGELIGVITLNDDRVGRQQLSIEDSLLLEALAAQIGSSLLNMNLSTRLRRAKEVETFQTVSTFFVHDLKNLASRLSLTMQNLPANFDNPEFRGDALRVISTTVTKINGMCERLALLKQNVELNLSVCDVNALVTATLTEFRSNLRAGLEQSLRPVPKTLMDPEQIQKVITNLIINANEAVNGNGWIHVSTACESDTVAIAVRDNGSGMSEEFIEKSLFRPFQTTKKKGLGIGLFHSKLIVEAHHGKIEVNSSVGAGTEFRIILPLAT